MLPYSDHSQYCKKQNATLVSLHSKVENKFVLSLLSGKSFVTGGRRESGEEEFNWDDGSRFDYFNWKKDRFTHDTSVSVFLGVNADGTWDEWKDDYWKYPAICQREIDLNDIFDMLKGKDFQKYVSEKITKL